MTNYVPNKLNQSKPGATPLPSTIACSLSRRDGDMKNDAFLKNRTESSTPPMKSENYPWKDPGSGYGGNIRR